MLATKCGNFKWLISVINIHDFHLQIMETVTPVLMSSLCSGHFRDWKDGNFRQIYLLLSFLLKNLGRFYLLPIFKSKDGSFIFFLLELLVLNLKFKNIWVILKWPYIDRKMIKNSKYRSIKKIEVFVIAIQWKS